MPHDDDPALCPDCGAALAPGDLRCARCGAGVSPQTTIPRGASGPEVDAAWALVERASWAFLAAQCVFRLVAITWVHRAGAIDAIGAVVGLGLAVAMLRGSRARSTTVLTWGVMLSGAGTVMAVAAEVWARYRGLAFTRGEALSLCFGAVTAGFFAVLLAAQRRVER